MSGIAMENSKPRLAERAMVLEQVARALESLKHGALELTVHDGRVVQIERREKVRLDRCDEANARDPRTPTAKGIRRGRG